MKLQFGFFISLLLSAVQSQPQPAGLALKCIALTGDPKSLGLQEQPTGTGASPGVCITACSAFQIAYITGGANGKCFCSNDSSPSAESIASSTCDSICMDGNYSGCGGPSENGRSVFALYSTTGATNAAPSPNAKPGDGFTLPPAMYVYGTYCAVIFLVAMTSAVSAWIVREPDARQPKKSS